MPLIDKLISPLHFTILLFIICPYTYYRNTSDNHQRLHCPSIPGSRDTTSRSPRFPPQTGEMAPNPIPSATF